MQEKHNILNIANKLNQNIDAISLNLLSNISPINASFVNNSLLNGFTSIQLQCFPTEPPTSDSLDIFDIDKIMGKLNAIEASGKLKQVPNDSMNNSKSTKEKLIRKNSRSSDLRTEESFVSNKHKTHIIEIINEFNKLLLAGITNDITEKFNEDKDSIRIVYRNVKILRTFFADITTAAQSNHTETEIYINTTFTELLNQTLKVCAFVLKITTLLILFIF